MNEQTQLTIAVHGRLAASFAEFSANLVGAMPPEDAARVLLAAAAVNAGAIVGRDVAAAMLRGLAHALEAGQTPKVFN